MSPFTLHAGDNREVLKTLEDNSVDAIVCDPPYHLTSGKKGGNGEASVNLESPYGRARVTTGFMGMTWDGGDVANRPETWAECLRVAKPGAWLLAFGGTRTFHRMACAIEDAGWELRDAPVRGHVHQPEDCPWLMGWMYGSGFPKSHNGEWGGTALKPAWEPIVCARKPLIGTVAENFAAYGTGGLNIDGCRVGFESEDDKAAAKPCGKTTAKSGNLAGKSQDGFVVAGPVVDGERLYWSNETGWGSRDGATVFNDFDVSDPLEATGRETATQRAEFVSVQGTGRWPANLILSYNEDEFELRPGVTAEQRKALLKYLYENT